MFEELLRLIKAFIKKSDETSFLNAVKISYQYIIDKDSLYNLGLFDYPNFYGDKKKIFINPLVSILVVSYNSGDDLIELFDSINKQTYKNLELILVENGSQKSDVYLNNLEIPNKFISSNNIGFASANNLALEHSKGSFVCLVNPDTVLEKNVIEKLLLNIKFSQNVAVSVPKIVFYRKFFDIEISSNVKFNIDTNSLINSLNYEKYFIRKGEKVYYKNLTDFYFFVFLLEILKK